MNKVLSLLITLALLLPSFSVQAAETTIISTANFSYQTFTTLTNRALISFSLTANTVSDGVIGITSSTKAPSDYSDYAICFRIRAGAFFDANNGSDFSFAESMSYEKDKTYSVLIDADITNQVYNAYVTSPSGVKCKIADCYAFRTPVSDLGRITARGGWGVAAGLYSISALTAAQGEGEFEMFTLPNFYAENMVLQRGKPHLVFGKANGSVRVRLEKGTLVSETTVNSENGTFRAYLEPLPASLEPYTLTVSTPDKTQVINSVYIGDVFLLAGQSNMAQNYNYQTTEQLGGGVTTSNLPTRVSDERIKHFTVNTTAGSSPTFDIPFKNGSWQPLTEDNNKTLSYIGMFFAEERLQDEPDVPIGLISAAWNGTTINRWMRNSSDNKTLNYTPSNGDIFNTHIAPIVSYPLSAILWYQGESDASNPVAYAEAFPQLIRDWRSLWGDESLPFLFVQLARYSSQNYAPQREAQLEALGEENVGMAVILDTDKGTYNNIHPLGKETIAHRLKLLADKYVYGKDITAEGPLFESAEIADGSITVSFRPDTIGGGLVISNTYSNTSASLCEFEIAPSNGQFVSAEAVINSDNTITVSSPLVPEPAYVRYAYSAVPENPNLFNADGLPASPFTTDTRLHSAASYLTRVYDVESSSVQIASFDWIPFKDNIDGVVSLTARENSVSSWSSCGITVRFGTNGYIEYRDGSAYKTSAMTYSAGEQYKVNIIVDFNDKTYSLIIDGSVICEKAAFRTDALAMTNAGRLLVRGGDGAPEEQFAVSDYSIASPVPKTYLSADNGSVFFAVSPECSVYAAAYSSDTLLKAAVSEPKDGVIILRLPQSEKTKLFFWDDKLTPQ